MGSCKRGPNRFLQTRFLLVGFNCIVWQKKVKETCKTNDIVQLAQNLYFDMASVEQKQFYIQLHLMSACQWVIPYFDRRPTGSKLDQIFCQFHSGPPHYDNIFTSVRHHNFNGCHACVSEDLHLFRCPSQIVVLPVLLVKENYKINNNKQVVDKYYRPNAKMAAG